MVSSREFVGCKLERSRSRGTCLKLYMSRVGFYLLEDQGLCLHLFLTSSTIFGSFILLRLSIWKIFGALLWVA